MSQPHLNLVQSRANEIDMRLNDGVVICVGRDGRYWGRDWHVGRKGRKRQRRRRSWGRAIDRDVVRLRFVERAQDLAKGVDLSGQRGLEDDLNETKRDRDAAHARRCPDSVEYPTDASSALT